MIERLINDSYNTTVFKFIIVEIDVIFIRLFKYQSEKELLSISSDDTSDIYVISFARWFAYMLTVDSRVNILSYGNFAFHLTLFLQHYRYRSLNTYSISHIGEPECIISTNLKGFHTAYGPTTWKMKRAQFSYTQHTYTNPSITQV